MASTKLPKHRNDKIVVPKISTPASGKSLPKKSSRGF